MRWCTNLLRIKCARPAPPRQAPLCPLILPGLRITRGLVCFELKIPSITPPAKTFPSRDPYMTYTTIMRIKRRWLVLNDRRRLREVLISARRKLLRLRKFVLWVQLRLANTPMANSFGPWWMRCEPGMIRKTSLSDLLAVLVLVDIPSLRAFPPGQTTGTRAVRPSVPVQEATVSPV